MARIERLQLTEEPPPARVLRERATNHRPTSGRDAPNQGKDPGEGSTLSEGNQVGDDDGGEVEDASSADTLDS